METDKITAVIFDFDGVIVDSEPLHLQAFQRVLSCRDIELREEAYWEKYIGFDDRDAFRTIFSDDGKSALNDAELEDLIREKADAFMSIVRQGGVRPYPGVEAFLKKLKRSGIPTGIASGAVKSDISIILEKLGWIRYFSFIVTAEDVERSKPDPETYQKACAALPSSGPLSTVLAIEDTPAGITAARKAGLTVAAITNTLPAEKLTAADVIATDCSVLADQLNL